MSKASSGPAERHWLVQPQTRNKQRPLGRSDSDDNAQLEALSPTQAAQPFPATADDEAAPDIFDALIRSASAPCCAAVVYRPWANQPSRIRSVCSNHQASANNVQCGWLEHVAFSVFFHMKCSLPKPTPLSEQYTFLGYEVPSGTIRRDIADKRSLGKKEVNNAVVSLTEGRILKTSV